MSIFNIITEKEKTYQIEPLSDQQFLINGEEKEVDFIQLKKGKYHLIMDHQSYQLELISNDLISKELTIRVNGSDYTLKVEDRFDILLQKLGMDDLASSGITELKAPMPGLVLSIAVEAGQEVKKDEPLIVLEAMKMENVLKAPEDVIIKAISVESSQAVEKNQVLIEFEA